VALADPKIAGKNARHRIDRADSSLSADRRAEHPADPQQARVSGRLAGDADRRHWFYDNRALVALFCLLSVVAIFWQVSRFEGFQPIFTCGGIDGIDREVLQSGMEACMASARSQAAQGRCMHVVYVLSCTDERWR
jgi:hypothetical protein